MIIYLYVKQHIVTGLLYFGVTRQKNPLKYKGSGVYWKKHLSKYGNNVKTLEVWGFDDINICSDFAWKFSKDNDIVESEAWANLIPENGTDGTTGIDNTRNIDYVKTHANIKNKTYEQIYGPERAAILKQSRSESNKRTKRGVQMSELQRAKRRHPYGPRSDEFKSKLSLIARSRPKVSAVCPHCGKQGVLRSLKRWHFDRCKSYSGSIIATL